MSWFLSANTVVFKSVIDQGVVHNNSSWVLREAVVAATAASRKTV